jgi:multidrug resistance efflux pump
MNEERKQQIIIVAAVVGLIAGAFLAGWVYYSLNPDQWSALTVELSGEGSDSPGPRPAEPSPVRRQTVSRGDLRASGNIEAEEVTIAAEIGGRVTEITADEGDIVTANQLILRIDQATLLAQREAILASIAQAQGALDASQAAVDRAETGATPEEIAAAEAAVLVAEGAVAAAEAARDQAEINAGSARTVQEVESSVAMAEANLAAAQGAVEVAEANLAAASANLARLNSGGRPEEIAMYQFLVNQAQSEFLITEQIHFENFIDKELGGGGEERARYTRESARNARDAAQAQLDLAKAGASSEEVAAGYAAVSAAQGQIGIAEAGVQLAEAQLASARANPETSEDSVAVALSGVTVAGAQVKIAEGQLAQAEAELARVRAGVTAETRAGLVAQRAQAQAVLAGSEANLKALDIEMGRTALAAPTDGVVLQRFIHKGELAAPGAPLFTLADIDEVTLTVYVPEAELGKVALGQLADVTVDSYADVFHGEVSYIASQAEFTPKNVQTQEERVHMVFAVKIRLQNPDHLLKPGMPADAIFR